MRLRHRRRLGVMIFLGNREYFFRRRFLIYRWFGGFYPSLRQLSLGGLMIGQLV